MVHVQHQHGNADEDEHIGDDHGDAGYLTTVLELHLSHRQDGVGEGGDNNPMASWLGLSRRNVCTIRGENCPMASWTTTIVMVRTSAANETIETAIVVKMPSAASGPPVNHRGMTLKSRAHRWPSPTNRTTPARTHTTGMNQRLDRTVEAFRLDTAP